VRHIQSDELLDRRMECLAGRKRSLAAAVEVMQLRPAQAVARAGELVSSLGEIEICADTGILLELGSGGEGDRAGSKTSNKATAQRRAELSKVRQHLARVGALFATGDLVATEAELTKADQLEKVLDDEHLRADLRYYEGRIKLVRGDIADSIALFDRAAEMAMASRHDELLADIWLILAREVGVRDFRPAQTANWLAQGEAWIRRLGHARDPRKPWAEHARGNLQLSMGETKDALETFTRAIASAEYLWGKDDTRLIALFRDRSQVHARMRQAKEAIADAERALSLGVTAWGAEYPDIARTRRALGLLYIEQLGDVERGRKEIELAIQLFRAQAGEDSIEVANCEQVLTLAGQYRGDYVSALEHAERAEKIYRLKLGENHPRRGEALIGVGVARFMRKDFAGSLEAYQLASPIMRGALGEEHSSIAVLRSNIGEVLLVLGRAEAAREEFEKALRILEKSLGSEHADLALPLKGLGLAYLDGKRANDALAPLERALSLRTRSASASDPNEVAEIRWALARALRGTGRTPARAKELATAALETYRTLGPESAERVREISGWLRSSSAKPAR
jgi:eukaryotic-like serine/threonine-protein kinase